MQLASRVTFSLAMTALLFGCPPSGPTVPPQIVSFTASTTSLPAGGGQVTLSWVQTDATTLELDNGVGSVKGLSSKNVFIGQTTTFTLSAVNKLGADSKQVTINVAVPQDPPTISGFTATPSSFGILGGKATLTWSAQNATSLFIDNGVGNVAGRNSIDVNVTETKTFTLTAQNQLGQVTAQTTVTVAVPTQPPAIQSFTASDTHLAPGGGWVTLSWASTDATSLSIDNGVGNVLGRNSIQVRVTQTTTFKLTATNVKGSAQSALIVLVDPRPAPRITSFSASPSTRVGPGYVTLNWSASEADELYIDGVGDVTWDFGSTQVWVNSTRTFTLRATNESGTAQFSLTVTVTN